jgi:hypothetical protein
LAQAFAQVCTKIDLHHSCTDSRCSATNAVQAYPFTANGIHFTLIDTPGFDDTDLDDEEVFTSLAEWLEKSYRKGQRLSGMLYLHRIIDNREKGSDMRNLRMFKKLCGEENFGNVILGITWWDKEDPEVAASREKILAETPQFWGDMIAKGSKIRRIPHEDAKACTKILLELAGKDPTTLRIQDEMVEQEKSARDTSAASEMEDYDAIRAIRDSEALESAAQQRRYEEKLQRQRRKAEQNRVKEKQAYEARLRQTRLEAEALAEQKRREEEYERQRLEMQRRRRSELKRQRRELAEKEERARKVRLEAERANQERLRVMEMARIKRRSEAHDNLIQSQWRLIQSYANSGRPKQLTVRYLSMDKNWSHFRSVCDQCLRQLPFYETYYCKLPFVAPGLLSYKM